MTDDLTTQLRDAAGTATPLGLDPADLRGRADRRHRTRLAAGGAVATLVAVGIVALALPGSGGKASLEVPATAGPSVVATVEPTTEPTEGSSTAVATLLLNGDSLGTTQFGDSKQDAIAAVTAVLGEPTELDPSTTTCIDADTEVFWKHFGLGFDKDGKLNGWFSGDIDAATLSSIKYGSTVAVLKETYGARLHITNNTDHGWQFFVDGVAQVGDLTGNADTDTVTGFASGSCTGP